MDKKSQTKVKVIIRVRPILNEDSITCVNSSKSNNFVEIFNHRNKNEILQYDFSSVYDGTASQKEIFYECVDPLLENSFQGRNVSIFAYGPTGAGKTHTMLGLASNPGIIPRVMKWLFERIDKDMMSSADLGIPKTVITFSYLEIYNEKVRDLLIADSNDLPIREDNKHNIFVAGLTEKTVDSFETFKNNFGPACNNRSVAATNLNEHSSRSHSIVQLKVTRRFKDKEYIGKIHLIDLAGSEDNRRTGNKGIRLKESGAINRSLFALGEVVDAINKNLGRIPYRNSKLTRLLQDSLGGSCHSLMVTNIAPEDHYYYDTYCTLNFASKSKKIVNTTTTTVNSLEMLHKPLSLKRSGSSDSALVRPKKLKKQVSSSTLSSSNSSVSSSISGTRLWKSSVNERIEELEKQLLEFRDCVSANKQKLMSEESRTSPVQTCRRSNRLSSSSPFSPSLKTMSQSDSGIQQDLLDLKNSRLRLSLVDTDESPDIVYATPVIKKRKNALKDKSNLFQNLLERPKNKIHGRWKRIVDSGPSCSPLFSIFSSDKKHRRKRVSDKIDTPFGKTKVTDSPGLSSTWQEKRKSAFLNMLNASSTKELQQLQTVGAKRAKLIFEWRELHGPFIQVETLKQIPGISDKYFEKLLKNNLVTQ